MKAFSTIRKALFCAYCIVLIIISMSPVRFSTAIDSLTASVTSFNTSSNYHNKSDDFNYNYIDTAEWPPRTIYSSSTLSLKESCNISALEYPYSYATSSQKVIQSTHYCEKVYQYQGVGSTFKTYVYTKKQKNNTVTTSFSLRFPQCSRFNEPQASDCEKEQRLFDPLLFLKT